MERRREGRREKGEEKEKRKKRSSEWRKVGEESEEADCQPANRTIYQLDLPKDHMVCAEMKIYRKN